MSASLYPRAYEPFEIADHTYSAALSLARHFDLNDLHSLSLTSRSIHRNLTQFSQHLKAQSLRCTFDDQPLLSDLRKSHSPSSNEHSRSPEFGIHFSQYGQFTSSYKISSCARDNVASCRKCGIVVCRNCVVKPLSNKYLPERHRRLCRTCLDAPLAAHLEALTDDLSDHDTPPRSGASSVRSARSHSSSSRPDDEADAPQPSAFTHPAFLRLPCACATYGAYLCAACGHNLRANDTTYRRVWTWRSRYSTHIGGGLGVGLGMGDQGQKCGRGSHCLDSSTNSVSWVEIDCSDGDGDSHYAGSRVGTPVPNYQHRDTPTLPHASNGTSNKPGYHQQEIEGIGGVVKKKVRKRVKTGATVWEYDDERTSGKYLARETSGVERSWCGWCDRVCLGVGDDLAAVLGSAEKEASI
jgi:hypothetical protein